MDADELQVQHGMQPQNVVQNFAILICAGRSPQFPTQVDEKSLCFDVPSPHLVNALSIALLPCALPNLDEKGLTVFAATELDPNFKLISTLTAQKQSVIIQKPFGPVPKPCGMGKIGLSLESKSWCDSFKTVVKSDGTSHVSSLAIKIAENLKNYTSSFERTIPGEMVYVAIPKQLCEKWYERFKQKWNKDGVFRANFV